uniref:DUF1109 family protein n=1 Tax=Phenylobacterium glaciei TaxID=2803784 RepID=A0A974S7G6_9CAUL|nr:DUF1109 family protein [Phenylobacterium glaciei]
MKTDDLIERLTADLEPASPWWVTRRILIGLSSGAFFSALLMIFWLGVRPDLMDAMTGTMFWMKFAYTLACSAILAWALIRGAAGRVDGLTRLGAGGAFALVALMAVARLAKADPVIARGMLMGIPPTCAPGGSLSSVSRSSPARSGR